MLRYVQFLKPPPKTIAINAPFDMLIAVTDDLGAPAYFGDAPLQIRCEVLPAAHELFFPTKPALQLLSAQMEPWSSASGTLLQLRILPHHITWLVGNCAQPPPSQKICLKVYIEGHDAISTGDCPLHTTRDEQQLIDHLTTAKISKVNSQVEAEKAEHEKYDNTHANSAADDDDIIVATDRYIYVPVVSGAITILHETKSSAHTVARSKQRGKACHSGGHQHQARHNRLSYNERHYNFRFSSLLAQSEMAALGHRTVLIREQFGRDLGSHLWDASWIMCNYLWHLNEKHRGLFRGKKVVELGSGCGLVGICASLLGADVTMTDLSDIVPLLTKNVSKNRSLIEAADGSVPEVRQLDWSDTVQVDNEVQRCATGGSRLVLATDVLYSDSVCAAFIATLRALLHEVEDGKDCHDCCQALAVVAYKLRCPLDNKRLLETLTPDFKVTLLASTRPPDSLSSPPSASTFCWSASSDDVRVLLLRLRGGPSAAKKQQ